MRRYPWAAVVAFLMTVPAGANEPAAGDNPKGSAMIETQRFGLYVLVSDVEESVVFYETLFGKSPQIRTPALVGFDISGGLLGIVDRATYGNGSTLGNSVRPYIRVTDIEKVFAHAHALAPNGMEGPGIVSEGPFKFFRMSDPDGNVLEFFSFDPAAN